MSSLLLWFPSGEVMNSISLGTACVLAVDPESFLSPTVSTLGRLSDFQTITGMLTGEVEAERFSSLAVFVRSFVEGIEVGVDVGRPKREDHHLLPEGFADAAGRLPAELEPTLN